MPSFLSSCRLRVWGYVVKGQRRSLCLTCVEPNAASSWLAGLSSSTSNLATKNIFLIRTESAGIENFISNVFRKDSVQEKLAKACKSQACLGLSELWYEPQRNSREMTTPFHVIFWLPLGDEQWNMWLLKRNIPNREEEGLDILVWIYGERGKAVRQTVRFYIHSSFLLLSPTEKSEKLGRSS